MTSNKKTLYVGGLEENVTVETLRGAFIPFGEIKDISLPLDYKTQKHKGYCFIEFDTREDALDAVDNMHDSEIFGKTINCTIAKQSTVDKNKSLWSSENYQAVESFENEKEEQKDFINDKINKQE